MKLRILITLLRYVLSQIEPDMVKALVDDMLDKVEDAYSDNVVLMQSIALVRSSFSIPDDIGGDED